MMHSTEVLLLVAVVVWQQRHIMRLERRVRWLRSHLVRNPWPLDDERKAVTNGPEVRP